MAKFPEAEARLFENVYVCLKCNALNRVDKRRIRLGKAKCRECHYTRLRSKKKK
jgi:ribosomal protein L40E